MCTEESEYQHVEDTGCKENDSSYIHEYTQLVNECCVF
jgi:hypothetical protein